MKIKVTYVIRWKEDDKYCSTEHIEITEEDIEEYIKLCRPPTIPELYIEDGIEITGLEI